MGYEVSIERGSGSLAFFDDDAYRKVKATVESDPAALLGTADLALQVNPPAVHEGRNEVEWLRPGAVWLGSLMPLRNLDVVRALAARRVSAFSTDAIPRISRAQSMDTLTSMSNIVGYKGVLPPPSSTSTSRC
jgi:NAD(P) transhydrogenase subunit alpha